MKSDTEKKSGFGCPFCGNENTYVIDTRRGPKPLSRRRRRECLACNRRFTTYESVVEGKKASASQIRRQLRVVQSSVGKLLRILKVSCVGDGSNLREDL